MSTDARKPIIESRSRRLIRTRHGYMLYDRMDSGIAKEIEGYGEYFESEVAIFRLILRPGDVAIDVGANIGVHTLAMAELVKESGMIVAFEPQRRVFGLLSGNVALNGLSNVVCVNAVVGREDGEMRLSDLPPDQPADVGAFPIDYLKGDVRTPVYALDTFGAFPPVKLIKIDVEGMELDVLQGASKTLAAHRPAVYVENNRPDKSRALIEFLRGAGYRCHWHLASHFNPNNFYGNPQRLGPDALIDRGPEHPWLYYAGGAINMLCVPQHMELTGLKEVADADESPMKRQYAARFKPN